MYLQQGKDDKVELTQVLQVDISCIAIVLPQQIPHHSTWHEPGRNLTFMSHFLLKLHCMEK